VAEAQAVATAAANDAKGLIPNILIDTSGSSFNITHLPLTYYLPLLNSLTKVVETAATAAKAADNVARQKGATDHRVTEPLKTAAASMTTVANTIVKILDDLVTDAVATALPYSDLTNPLLQQNNGVAYTESYSNWQLRLDGYNRIVTEWTGYADEIAKIAKIATATHATSAQSVAVIDAIFSYAGGGDIIGVADSNLANALKSATTAAYLVAAAAADSIEKSRVVTVLVPEEGTATVPPLSQYEINQIEMSGLVVVLQSAIVTAADTANNLSDVLYNLATTDGS
jgi:hypothetical protein